MAAGAIDPNTLYRVKVARAVPLGRNGRTVLKPQSDNVVRGRLLATLKPEDIVSFEPVDAGR